MTSIDSYIDDFGFSESEQCQCRCRCKEPMPAVPLYTPDRRQAALSEAKYVVDDLDAAAALLNDRYERRGDGWIDEVVVSGRPWPRAAVWMHPPRHLHVEASSREAFAEVCAVVAGLPSTVRRQSRREHNPYTHQRYYGYQPQPLLRGDALANRPSPSPAEALAQMWESLERRWLQRPHPLLGDISPEEAVKDDDKILDLYDLLELAQVRGRDRVGLPPGADLGRIRDALDIGHRW